MSPIMAKGVAAASRVPPNPGPVVVAAAPKVSAAGGGRRPAGFRARRRGRRRGRGARRRRRSCSRCPPGIAPGAAAGHRSRRRAGHRSRCRRRASHPGCRAGHRSRPLRRPAILRAGSTEQSRILLAVARVIGIAELPQCRLAAEVTTVRTLCRREGRGRPTPHGRGPVVNTAAARFRRRTGCGAASAPRCRRSGDSPTLEPSE